MDLVGKWRAALSPEIHAQCKARVAVWAETPTKSGVGHSLHTGAKGESGSDQGFVRCEVLLLPRLAKMPGGRVVAGAVWSMR